MTRWIPNVTSGPAPSGPLSWFPSLDPSLRMHFRNPYRIPPNFEELAEQYPLLKPLYDMY